MVKLAAGIVVYEASPYLEEVIRRIYPLVDHIFFFVNYKPWNGLENEHGLMDTYKRIVNMFDPYKKLEIISRHWLNETEQRNYSSELMKQRGFTWNFIIDDDEQYNYDQLKTSIARIKADEVNGAFLIRHKIYWRNPNWTIKNESLGLPAFANVHKTRFTENRMLAVYQPYSWYTFKPEEILNHHYSYVRDNTSLQRKISTFSHHNEFEKKWYTETWCKWAPHMTDLGPNPLDVKAFQQAVPSSQEIEECPIIPSVLETTLRKSNSFKHEIIKYEPTFESFLQRFLGILLNDKYATDIALINIPEGYSSLVSIITKALDAPVNIQSFLNKEHFRSSYFKFNFVITNDNLDVTNNLNLYPKSIVVVLNPSKKVNTRLPQYHFKNENILIYES